MVRKLRNAATLVVIVVGAAALVVFLWQAFLASNAGLESSGVEASSGPAGISWALLICLVAGLSALTLYLWREIKRIRHNQYELAKFSLVANKTDSAVMILNRKGLVEWINDGFSKVTGFSFRDVDGQRPADILLGSHGSEKNQETIMQAVENRKTISLEMCCTHKMGNPYWMSLTLTPVYDEKARLVQFVGIGTNITARKRAEDALARMNQWYELMLNAMREGICGVDINGMITFINPAVTGMTGWKAGELIGKPVSHLMHQLHVSGMPESESNPFINVAFKDNTVLMGDADVFRRKDGGIFPVDYTSTTVRQDDQLVGFVVVFRDITERCQGEAVRARQARQFALRAEIGFCLANSDTLADFIEGSANSIVRHLDGALGRVWLYNADEEMLELNASVGLSTRIDGPDSQIPLGTFTVGRIGRTGEPELIRDLYSEAKAQEVDEDWVREERLVSFVGLPLVVETKLIAVLGIYSRKRLPEDTLDLLGALADAIGQGIVRKRAEEKVAEQAALLDKSQDAILVIDLDNKCQYWNKSAETLYGWPAREMLGERVDQMIFANPKDFLRAKKEVLCKGELKEESRQLTRDGEALTVESHWTVVNDRKGEPKSILQVNTNVTDRKAMESNYLQNQREKNIGTLACGIAHDLNNILSPILMSVELLKDRCDDHQSQRLLEMVESNAKRGGDMVKQILTFSRGAKNDPAMLKTADLVNEVTRIVEETIPKSINLKLDLPDNLWPLMGDATQLHQVMANLTLNACDAISEGGTLTIAAENLVLDTAPVANVRNFKPGFFVKIRVTDTGSGLPRKSIGRAFESLFTTKEKSAGTGPGLSAALGIVKRLGGFIEIESGTKKRGTAIDVYLPAIDTANPEATQTTPTRLPSGQGKCILAVDDETAVLSMTREMLETSGYEVITAADGTEAVALFSENRDRVKAVVTDMIMPYMDGPATIRTLKKMDPDVPVIAASGLMDEDKVKEATGLEDLAFLGKPFTAETLLGAVDAAVTAGGSASETMAA